MQKIQKYIHIYNTEQDSRVKPISVWCSALFDSSNNTPVRLCISSFLNLSHFVTPHILLKHLFSMTSRRFLSAVFIPQVSAAHNAVGTITLSYSPLLTFIPSSLFFQFCLYPHSLTRLPYPEFNFFLNFPIP